MRGDFTMMVALGATCCIQNQIWGSHDSNVRVQPTKHLAFLFVVIIQIFAGSICLGAVGDPNSRIFIHLKQFRIIAADL